MHYKLREVAEKTGISEKMIIKWFTKVYHKGIVKDDDKEYMMDEDQICLFQETLICWKTGMEDIEVEELMNGPMRRKDRLHIIGDYAMSKIRNLESILDTIEVSENNENQTNEDLDLMFWELENGKDNI